MGGCTNCASKGSCSTRKGEERELLGRLLPELYPSRRWGEIDDDRRDGVSEREGRRLARQASALLRAPAWFRPGEPDELCDWIWVLCVGRQPALVELQVDGRGELTPARDKYLRVALSQLARVVTVQEVSLDLRKDGDDWLLAEEPAPGVYDPILLPRTQKLVELLVASELTLLDFGIIETPPLGFEGAAYTDAFGEPPAIVNYLFMPRPARTVATQLLPGGSA